MTTEVKVTETDCDAAADFLESWEPGPEMTVVKLARALAKHRLAERARIVAWLRSPVSKGSEDGVDWADTFADRIERGDHEGKGR